MIYYTSDLHLGHKNILKHEPNRPGKTIEEHDEILIDNINKKCSENDDLYILGDISLKYHERIYQLLLTIKPKTHLVVGNHDSIYLKYELLRHGKSVFDSINNYLHIKDECRDVILFHYPIFNWDNQKHGSYHLYGHVHNKPSFQLNLKNSFNVGCMLHDFYPVSLDELINQDDISNLKIQRNA